MSKNSNESADSKLFGWFVIAGLFVLAFAFGKYVRENFDSTYDAGREVVETTLPSTVDYSSLLAFVPNHEILFDGVHTVGNAVEVAVTDDFMLVDGSYPGKTGSLMFSMAESIKAASSAFDNGSIERVLFKNNGSIFHTIWLHY